MCPLCTAVQAAHPDTAVTCHEAPRAPRDRHFATTGHYPRPGWTPGQECYSCASYDWRPRDDEARPRRTRNRSHREEGGSTLALAVVIVIVIVAVYCARQHPHEPRQYPTPEPPLYPADRKTPRRK